MDEESRREKALRRIEFVSAAEGGIEGLPRNLG